MSESSCGERGGEVGARKREGERVSEWSVGREVGREGELATAEPDANALVEKRGK
jgi:hypothetical protein